MDPITITFSVEWLIAGALFVIGIGLGRWLFPQTQYVRGEASDNPGEPEANIMDIIEPIIMSQVKEEDKAKYQGYFKVGRTLMADPKIRKELMRWVKEMA